MEDRKSVTIEFKISKNYNSIGGSVGYSSDRKPGETLDECFERVFKEADKNSDILFDKAQRILNSV